MINSALCCRTALDTIGLSSTLTAHSSEYIFYRTDHHWTSLGAYYAANALRSSWGLPEIDKDTLTQETVSEDFCGTLYSSSGFFWIAPDEMETLTAAPEKSSVARYETNGTDETLPLYNYDKLTIKDKIYFLPRREHSPRRCGYRDGKCPFPAHSARFLRRFARAVPY